VIVERGSRPPEKENEESHIPVNSEDEEAISHMTCIWYNFSVSTLLCCLWCLKVPFGLTYFELMWAYLFS